LTYNGTQNDHKMSRFLLTKLTKIIMAASPLQMNWREERRLGLAPTFKPRRRLQLF
jgi:hypothetical protein